MLLLGMKVVGNCGDIVGGDGESTVARLPCEGTLQAEPMIGEVRGSAFDLAGQPGHGDRGVQPRQEMNMIGRPARASNQPPKEASWFISPRLQAGAPDESYHAPLTSLVVASTARNDCLLPGAAD